MAYRIALMTITGQEFINNLRPRLLVHGHTTLTDLFTAEAVAACSPPSASSGNTHWPA
jgi:hypothetical protein